MTEQESRAKISALEARVKELEEALLKISELDCRYAATNGCAYVAVDVAKKALNPPAKEADNGRTCQ